MGVGRILLLKASFLRPWNLRLFKVAKRSKCEAEEKGESKTTLVRFSKTLYVFLMGEHKIIATEIDPATG